jgi:hypothetical protein
MSIDWRKKLGAHHKGVHPLLVETADHIEGLERQLAEAQEKLEQAGKLFKEYSDHMHEWVRWEQKKGRD